MGLMSVLSFAQKLITERVRLGDVVIDATLGNGVDTQFLANLVGPHGTVFGFDIQATAVRQSEQRLLENIAPQLLPQLHLYCIGHEHLRESIAAERHGQVAAVMFNLGYLPGSDQQLITQPNTTLKALQDAIEVLRTNGIVTVVLYPGHEGGDVEANQVEQWAAQLPSTNFDVLIYRMTNRHSKPPYLLAIEKKK